MINLFKEKLSNLTENCFETIISDSICSIFPSCALNSSNSNSKSNRADQMAAAVDLDLSDATGDEFAVKRNSKHEKRNCSSSDENS